jgi:hypothetical protein
MPDEVKDVSAEGAQEPKAPPVPDISAGSTQESSEPRGIDEDALAAKVVGQIQEVLPELIDRRFKSAKDKRLAKVEEILDAVKLSGGDPAKVQESLYRDDLLERISQLESRLSSGADRGRSGTPDEARERLESATLEILVELEKKYGVSLSEEEVSELAGSKTFRSEKQWLEAVGETAMKKAKQSTPSGSAVVAPSGSPAVSGSAEDVAGELQRIQRGEKGNPFSPENIKRREELKAKLNELEPMVKVEDPELRIDWTALREGY